MLRLAVLHDVPIACNRSSADYLISSPLFGKPEAYRKGKKRGAASPLTRGSRSFQGGGHRLSSEGGRQDAPASAEDTSAQTLGG